MTEKKEKRKNYGGSGINGIKQERYLLWWQPNSSAKPVLAGTYSNYAVVLRTKEELELRTGCEAWIESFGAGNG